MLITIYASGMGAISPVRGLLAMVAGRSATAAAQNLNILKYMQGD